MMKRTILSLLIFLVLTSGAEGLDQSVRPQQAGNLGIVVTVSDSLAYIEDWLATPPEKPISIHRIRSVKPDQVAYCAFLVTGVTPDEKNNYKFVVHFSLLGPDGKTVFDLPDYAQGSGRYPDKPMFVMADPALDLVLEDSDLEGRYIIKGTVKDLVSGRTAKATYTIVLRK